MATTLQDKIATNRKLVKGRGGVLSQESPEEIQTLAGKAGLQAPPTTAIGAGMIGANADQQKMMGSPQQMQAALRLSQEPSESLADVERRRQVRQEATASEEAAKQKSEDLKALGGLGDRVASFIDVQRQKLASQTVVPGQVQVNEQVIPITTGGATADQAQLKDVLKQLRADPGNQQLQLQANQLLGRGINSVLTPDEINGLYESSIATLARSGAETVQDKLQVEDLLALPEFGYDLNSLSDLLGLPPDQVSKLDLGQLQARVNEIQQIEFQQANQLGQAATSGQLGAAERQVARQAGQEASRTGLRSTEADVRRLDEAIARADEVSFGGNQYKIEDLLSDDTISGVISDYLNAPEGSPTRLQLEKTEPGLIQFIRSNQTLLDDAAKELGAGAQQFSATQQYNQQVATIGNQTLDPALAKQLIPGYGELSATQLDPNSVPLLQIAKLLPPTQGANLVSTVNALSQDPRTADSIASELAALSPEQLQQLHLELGPERSVALKQYLENRTQYNQIQNTDPNDIRSIIDAYTGGEFQDEESLQKVYQANKIANFLGLPSKDVSAFDSDDDGKLDPPASLLDRLKKSVPKATLADAASGKVPVYTPQGMGAPTLDNLQQEVYNKLADKVADGDLSVADFRDAEFGEDTLLQMADAGMLKDWPLPVRVQALQQLNAAANQRTQSALKEAYSTPPTIQMKQKIVPSPRVEGALTDAQNRLSRLNQTIAEIRAGDPRKADLGALESQAKVLTADITGLQKALDNRKAYEELHVQNSIAMGIPEDLAKRLAVDENVDSDPRYQAWLAQRQQYADRKIASEAQELERRKPAWVKKAEAMNASPRVMEGLLSILNTPAYRRKPEDVAALKRYGIDPNTDM